MNGDKLLQAKILVVDDQDISIRLLEAILKKDGFTNITLTTDPRQVKALYQEIRPEVLILDLTMPHLDGFQIMEQLKEIDGDTYLPIIVISDEQNQEVRFRALESGAKDFLNKPYDRVEVLIRIKNMIEVRMLHNEIQDQNKVLEQRVKDRTQKLYESQVDVIQRLARAVEYRDSETGMHIIRMSHYSECLAKKVGLSGQECEMILTASPLHDIGKIGIPDSILQKPGKLTENEWEIMKTHTTIGAELLDGSDSEFLKIAQEIALTHHEKWDGTGYPGGLKGEAIPLVGRICGLCDVFDALTSARPYKKAWSSEEAIEEIQKGGGTHFDSKLLEAFMEISSQIQELKEKYHDPRNNGDLAV